MKKNLMYSISLLVIMNLSACQNKSITNNMESNKTKSTSKSVTVKLKKGEIFVSFVTNRKPNTDSLFQSYLTSVFPVAIKHGAVPLANLVPDQTVAGNFQATDFIGLSKWPNQEAAMTFSEEMPEEKLDELRKPIWNNLKVFAIPVTEGLTFSIKENKTYEFKLIWGDDKHINQNLKQTKKKGGKVLFDFPVTMYKELQNGESPSSITLVEWDTVYEAEKARESFSKKLKEEAFYSHFEMTE